jgi:hypothetical protein
MAHPQQVHRLRPVPAMIFTFLVSAIAIAAADRVLGIQYHEPHQAEAGAQ